MIKKYLKPKPIFLIILALIGLFIVYSIINQRLQPLKVETAVSTRGDIQETVNVSGFLKAGVKADLGFGATTSKITWVNAKVGDLVATGSALLSLDASTLASEVTAADAAVSRARNAYFSVRSTETITNETYKDSDKNSPTVKAYLDQAWQNSRAADDALTSAESALTEAKINLSKSVLLSPISGTVTILNAGKGEIPSGVVAQVVDLNSLYFDVLVDELDIGKIKLSQPVTIKLDSAKDTQLVGYVSEISPTTIKDGSNNVTVEAKVAINDSKGIALRPGLEGDSQIMVNQHPAVVLVPFEAVVIESGQNYVWKIKNGRAIKQAVTTGLEGDLDTEITSGLSEGETIILNPAKTLVNGQAVTPK